MTMSGQHLGLLTSSCQAILAHQTLAKYQISTVDIAGHLRRTLNTENVETTGKRVTATIVSTAGQSHGLAVLMTEKERKLTCLNFGHLMAT